MPRIKRFKFSHALIFLLIIFNACRDAKIYRYTRIVHVHSNYPTPNLEKKKISNSEMCIRVKETSRSVNGLYPIFWTMLNKQSFLRVFWVNIVKSKVNLRYKNCSNLFGKLNILCPILLPECAWSARSEKKKKIDKLIVAMPLPK